MANYRMNKIAIGSDTYECAEWYGVCSTAAGTQAKTVSISGFTSAQLVEGCRVTVRFQYAQNYNGTPTLNVSSTGAKNIQSVVYSSAGQYEWQGGAVVAFVYYNGYWVIEDGAHANTTSFGNVQTTLSWVVDNAPSLATTPAAVRSAVNDIVQHSVYNGFAQSTLFVSMQTPSAAGWTVDGARASCVLTITDPSSYLGNTINKARVIEIKLGEYVFYEPISTEKDFFELYVNDSDINIVANGGEISIYMPSSDIGEYDFTVRLYSGNLLMTYPLMDYYLKENGYLTLADLPVWDGSVT